MLGWILTPEGRGGEAFYISKTGKTMGYRWGLEPQGQGKGKTDAVGRVVSRALPSESLF